ncbi:MAG: ATP-binding protein [Smithella sp.]|nr:ATP-binding protein [Smithella sp.]
MALANSRGGYILLGVSDDGKMTGEKLTNQMKAEISSLARNCDPHISIAKISQTGDVVAIEVPEGLEKPYSCSSGYFRRLDGMTQKMTQKEVRLIFRAATDMSFESLPCKGFSFEDVQLGKVRAFLKEAGASLKVTGANLPSFLSSLGICEANSINNAGALMFAADINRFIPHSETIMAAFKGVEKVHIYDRKDARTDLLSQFNAAMDFLKKQLNVRSEIYIDRREIYEIPLDALREALINALVHRDYSMRGTSIYVNIFDDRVDISNPGGLLPGVTTRNFGKESVRRNPVIADLFHRMGKVERMGTGIKRMKDLMREAGLKEPEFTSDTFFHAVFHRNPEYSLKRAGGLGKEKSKEKSREKILNVMAVSPMITTQQIAETIGLSLAGVEKIIRILKKTGMLRRVGPDKGGHWEVLSGKL